MVFISSFVKSNSSIQNLIWGGWRSQIYRQDDDRISVFLNKGCRLIRPVSRSCNHLIHITNCS
jgi:hypothetical protein